MRFLGFVFVSLITSTVILVGDYHLSGSYFENFIDNHFVETFAALAGFNIAAVIFLVGQLIGLEEKYDKEFSNTRSEIKQNAYFLLGSFVFCIIVLIFRPESSGNFVGNELYWTANLIVTTTFGLAIYSIFEILSSVFHLGKNSN
jgi:uncharacterized membrane protein